MVFLLGSTACRPGESPPPASFPTPTAVSATPTLPHPAEASHTPSATPIPTRTSTPDSLLLWIDPAVPALLRDGVQLPPGMALTEDAEQADLGLQVGSRQPVSQWIFTLVTAFPSRLESISSRELRQAWESGPLPVLGEQPLRMSQETLHVLTAWWGKPGPQAVEVWPPETLLDAAWANQPSLAIIPFEALEPRWKVCAIDGQSPVRKEFDPTEYALAVPFSLAGRNTAITQAGVKLPVLPASNRDPHLLTTVVLTGVTALVRGTALKMDASGITYPGQDIRSWLVDADILHISNEIPFYSLCPPAELYPAEIRFCSPPEYIGLLEDIGADIVELDGDHFGDYGTPAMLETLSLYQERGWPVYGGGANNQQARQAVLLEHNGNRFAFIGCNAKGIAYYATATDTNPGAAPCNFNWLTSEISRLKKEGYLVIATFQHNEYYTYQAQPDLVNDFRQAAAAGAMIVSGSQAHQPHGMEFHAGSFIHYGLGNLFFDQYRYFPGPELDRAFIDRHIFYNGRFLGTELLTIKFVDLARSRPTTPEERAKFLEEIFTASGW